MTVDSRPRVAVVQDGSRLHYALPLALQRAGLLERVFAPWYTQPRSIESGIAATVGRFAPALGQRMAQRFHPELDALRIVSNRWLALRQRIACRWFEKTDAYYAYCSQLESNWIARKGWGRANALGGFVRNLAPATCIRARDDGLAVVVDQMIAPAAIQNREALSQAERWPDWELPPVPDSVGDVEHATWKAATAVTCPSDYVRDGLIAQGVDPACIALAPYPVAASEFQYVERPVRSTVTVGFVGIVNLRKGAPYFAEVARRLAGHGIRFVMIGPVGLNAVGAAKLPESVELPGPLPRREIPSRLADFDLFYFPSTCEGSAGAVMEAMVSGLPIVVSPNGGSIVRDGIDGYLVAYDDVDAAAERIERLATDVELRRQMGRSAHDRAQEFDLDRYSATLADVYTKAVMAPKITTALLARATL